MSICLHSIQKSGVSAQTANTLDNSLSIIGTMGGMSCLRASQVTALPQFKVPVSNSVYRVSDYLTLEKPLVGQSTTSVLPIWSSGRFPNAVENAYMHWCKHQKEFPNLVNSKQYVEAACELLKDPNALTRVRNNGDIIRNHQQSNTIGFFSKDGIPKSMYKPDHSVHSYKTHLEYFYDR